MYFEALILFSTVAHSGIIRFLAINKIAVNSGVIPGKDKKVLNEALKTLTKALRPWTLDIHVAQNDGSVFC